MKKFFLITLVFFLALTSVGCENMFVINVDSYLMGLRALRHDGSPFSGVEMQLLDDAGNVISSTMTGDDGWGQSQFVISNQKQRARVRYIWWQQKYGERVKVAQEVTYHMPSRQNYTFEQRLADMGP